MRNSAIIFIFFGLIFTSAIVFAFIYLPKMASANGISNKNLVLELPVDKTLMRYQNNGVVPFCLNKSNGIDIEVKENSPVLSPVSGVITNIYSDSNRIAIQPSSSVEVYVSPVVKLNVSEGDFVNAGDVLGYTEVDNIHLSLDNQKNDRFECPYLYMDSSSKDVLSKVLEESVNSSSTICTCEYLKY